MRSAAWHWCWCRMMILTPILIVTNSHASVYVYVCACVERERCIYIYIYIYICIYTYIHTYIHIHTHTHTHVCVCVYTCTYMYPCIHICIYIYIYIYIYIMFNYSYIYVYIYVFVYFPRLRPQTGAPAEVGYDEVGSHIQDRRREPLLDLCWVYLYTIIYIHTHTLYHYIWPGAENLRPSGARRRPNPKNRGSRALGFRVWGLGSPRCIWDALPKKAPYLRCIWDWKTRGTLFQTRRSASSSRPQRPTHERRICSSERKQR